MKNKSVKILILLLVLSSCNTVIKSDNKIDNITKIENKDNLPTQFKGYELYSWKESDNWYFTLMSGTNRLKTFDEITSDNNSEDEKGIIKITEKDIDSLKNLLKRIPQNQEIFWVNNISGLSFPSEDSINEIKTFCNELNLKLTLVN